MGLPLFQPDRFEAGAACGAAALGSDSVCGAVSGKTRQYSADAGNFITNRHLRLSIDRADTYPRANQIG